MRTKKKFPLKRIEAGQYKTADGQFRVWHEPLMGDYPSRWFVNHSAWDETLYSSGFQTKWEAVAWLEKNGEEYAAEAER